MRVRGERVDWEDHPNEAIMVIAPEALCPTSFTVHSASLTEYHPHRHSRGHDLLLVLLLPLPRALPQQRRDPPPAHAASGAGAPVSHHTPAPPSHLTNTDTPHIHIAAQVRPYPPPHLTHTHTDTPHICISPYIIPTPHTYISPYRCGRIMLSSAASSPPHPYPYQHPPRIHIAAQDKRIAISDHVKVGTYRWGLTQIETRPLTHIIQPVPPIPHNGPNNDHVWVGARPLTHITLPPVPPIPHNGPNDGRLQWIDADHVSFRHPGGNNVINTDTFINHVVHALKPH